MLTKQFLVFTSRTVARTITCSFDSRDTTRPVNSSDQCAVVALLCSARCATSSKGPRDMHREFHFSHTSSGKATPYKSSKVTESVAGVCSAREGGGTRQMHCVLLGAPVLPTERRHRYTPSAEDSKEARTSGAIKAAAA